MSARQSDLRSRVRALLAESRAAVVRRTIEGPEAHRLELDALGRELLADFAESIERGGERRRGRLLWIFRPIEDDLELYSAALSRLLERAEERGRAAGILVSTTEDEPADCLCRCRAHRKYGCRICLRVEACEIHGDGGEP